ncbi:hypothetical protein JIG36_45575 [Actinoplanes sp. LDG1-06]|uniref:Uncharacterized protein n=1 Tax=Paractinoplanes ovalisporus TaxID=2810368 RepID=A0ABS2AST5_9ACTN|nr:hypothetical protein [Actinoplanes ovalisporus]MBM2622795.1 hypothetical protein [Actinoplanes ovalisporus]
MLKILVPVAVLAGSILIPAAAPAAVPAKRVVAKLTGQTRTVKSVAHYRSLAAVHADLQVTPRRAGRVTVVLQHRSGAKWVTDQTATFPTDAKGHAWVGLVSGNRKWTYRYAVRAVGDTAAATSPLATTASFTVD